MTKYIKTEHSYKLSKPEPLDSRLVVNSIEERDALVTNGEVYDSMEVYVRNDKKYKYNGSTWVDADYQTKIDECIKKTDECIKKTDECIKKTDGVNELSINSTEQQYANAKATYLHIEERLNAIKSAKKVWDKPLLNLDTTELNTIYYYQTGDNAWMNKLWIPPTQDYGPGLYTYFDGIKWLTFNVVNIAVPSLSEKDKYKFYVLYDEKQSKCQSRAVEIATGTDSAIGGWSDITTSDEKPEGATQVAEEKYDRLGVWYKTVYLGDDKTNCFDITVPLSQDETGYLMTGDISTEIDENSTNLTIPTSKAVYDKLTELSNRHVYVHHISYCNATVRSFFVTIINNNKNPMTVQDFVDYLKSNPNVNIQASGGIVFNGEGECSSISYIYYAPAQDKIHMRGNRTAVLYDANTNTMSLSTSRCANPDWGNSLSVDTFISTFADLTDSVEQVI